MAHNLFKKEIAWFKAETNKNWKVKVARVKVNSGCLLPLQEGHYPVLCKIKKFSGGEGIWVNCPDEIGK